ncbi:hypothetical protein [Chrysanthemum yellows phytoplasma]|uniref:hypothetical protein n=2 Tax=16SrI (Aster yellows group) TaxID=3042590 RepID=UPI00054CB550|nr:hypothetical protein [Chrysanthemum yellows phytoplasma]
MILFLIGFKLIIILICCFYKLSLYYWNCFLPIALHLMVILVGFLYAALFCFYRFYGKQYLDFSPFIQHLIPLVPLISLLITILILVFITVLYKINKIKVYPGFIKVLKIFFLISFIGEIICFSLYCYHNYFSNFFFLIILIFLSLITFIIGILRWVYVLHQLDNFAKNAKNKVLAKECEWILVNFLWLSSMEVFCGIFELFIYVITYLGNIKNDKR